MPCWLQFNKHIILITLISSLQQNISGALWLFSPLSQLLSWIMTSMLLETYWKIKNFWLDVISPCERNINIVVVVIIIILPWIHYVFHFHFIVCISHFLNTSIIRFLRQPKIIFSCLCQDYSRVLIKWQKNQHHKHFGLQWVCKKKMILNPSCG